MRDFLSTTGGATRVKLSNIDNDNLAIWTTERVNKIHEDIEHGLIDIKTLRNSPFKDNDPVWKKPGILFEYTPDEIEEIRKCKNDIIYFATTYAKIMTDDGIQQLPIRDYQIEILKEFDANRFNILNASRQVGKTVMSAIYIAWYLIFEVDKNVLTVANIASTTKEVIDKIKSILEHLPFFLKPGCVSNNVMSMKFDNGNRLIGRTTTKNTGIGFTVHVLYIDEFAHINPTYLDFFYRAIYPTISASKGRSKIIITSTPNGLNKFYEIYMDALEGKNNYKPLRIDWWQVPGRDEKWKQMTIADMGSEEDFNQEFGLQFFSSDTLLLPSISLKKLFKIRTDYIVPLWTQDPEIFDLLDGFTVHPSFNSYNRADIKNSTDHYIFSIDTADGLGRNYSVINIFKFVALPINTLEHSKDFIKNETDIFSLIQVATYRTNTKDINHFCNTLEYLMFDVFNTENIRLLVELNHKGDYVMDKIVQNENYWPGLLIFSKHTELAQTWKPGLRLNMHNKIKYCERFKYLTAINRILVNEHKSIHELGSFGRAKNGTYRSQSGNDDLAMTCVNMSAFFESPNFSEIAYEALELLPKEYLDLVYQKYLSNVYYEGGSQYDFGVIGELNATIGGITRRNLGANNVNSEYISNYQEIMARFYGDSSSNQAEYSEDLSQYRILGETLR